MNRRRFLRQAGLMGIGLMAVHFPGLVYSNKTRSKAWKNWVWITPIKDLGDEVWLRHLEKLKKNDVDGILLQVYSSHNAWWNTDHLPVEEPLLEKFIGFGKKIGLEIHAWMWTMVNNNRYYIERHPDWYAKNRLGQSTYSHPAYVPYYRFLCPNNPEVVEFIKGTVQSLASIQGISGVHLDYVRLPDVILAEGLQPKYNIIQDQEYPEYDYCYCETCRNKFMRESGIDPMYDLEDPSANSSWRQFRYDSISRLVNDELAPIAWAQDVSITAAVFPNWQSVRQEWRKWKLDAYFPMLYHNFYNADLQWIGDHLEKQISELENPVPVYAGLFIPSLNPGELKQALRISKESGASGASFFAFNSLTEKHLNIIHKL